MKFEGYSCEDCNHADRNCESCDGKGSILHCIECGEKYDTLAEAQAALHFVPEFDLWRCNACEAEAARQERQLREIYEQRAKTIARHTERGAA